MEAVIHVEVPVILQDIYIVYILCSSQGGGTREQTPGGKVTVAY